MTVGLGRREADTAVAITRVVTPCHDDGASSESQVTWPS